MILYFIFSIKVLCALFRKYIQIVFFNFRSISQNDTISDFIFLSVCEITTLRDCVIYHVKGNFVYMLDLLISAIFKYAIHFANKSHKYTTDTNLNLLVGGTINKKKHSKFISRK